MTEVVEAVPNFSEGRDAAFVAAAADAFGSHGCEVLHTTMDPDHHRSVVTVIGSPEGVERGALAAARLALGRLDLGRHRGVHPRVGALDVLPFVPLRGVALADVVRLARRVGRAIARLGIPVHYYAGASDPPGRTLASIRRAGGAAHPTAGATCVGARPVLLAWNVDVEGLSLASARAIAGDIREAGGGFRSLRALALRLHRQRRLQVSMNLEDPSITDPLAVYRAIEERVVALGGRVVGTEVIGMLPDELADPARASEMRIRDWSEDRVLSRRVAAFGVT